MKGYNACNQSFDESVVITCKRGENTGMLCMFKNTLKNYSQGSKPASVCTKFISSVDIGLV